MSNEYMIGVSKKDITPSRSLIDARRIYLWGFGNRSGPTTTVLDRIWSRALAIGDSEGTNIVLVSLDISALSLSFVQRVKGRIANSRDIAAEYIAINVTHTHSAPTPLTVPTWKSGFDAPDPGYMAFLENQVLDIGEILKN